MTLYEMDESSVLKNLNAVSIARREVELVGRYIVILLHNLCMFKNLLHLNRTCMKRALVRKGLPIKEKEPY